MRRNDLSSSADADLVRAFAEDGCEAAFAELVRRYGPMVLRVCRRTLDDRHDADDAFQLTFLVLAKKSGDLKQPELVGNWLYGVALNVSRRARTVNRRRRAAESQMLHASAASKNESKPSPTSHVEHLIDQEIERLPAKYRAAVVACYLQGRTNREAADALGWPLGTLVTRLNRAKAALRTRVTARVNKENAAAITQALRRRAVPAAVPLALLSATLKAARKVHEAGAGGAGAIPAPHPLSAAKAGPARISLGRLRLAGNSQLVGAGSLGLALAAAITAVALGARHPAVAAQQGRPMENRSFEERRPDPVPARSKSIEARPATSRQMADAKDQAHSLAAAVTQTNRNAITPAPRRSSH